MKNKEKLIIVILLSLSLSAILTNVFGQTTYTCEAKIGEEFIFKVTTFSAYRTLPSWELGNKIKIKITDITEETDYFHIKYDQWDMISKNESFGATTGYDSHEGVFKDPSEGRSHVYFFVLSPVSNYLAEYAEANSYISSSGNVLTRALGGNTSGEITYDSDGIASKIQHSNSTTVLYVLSRGGGDSSIPGYDLSILIGLTAIAGVSIIYIVKKKMLK